MRKRQARDLVIGKEKIWNLAYADNKVLVAKEVNDLKEILKNFSKFLKKRINSLSVEKLKIMTYKKEEVKRKENDGCEIVAIEIEEIDHF